MISVKHFFILCFVHLVVYGYIKSNTKAVIPVENNDVNNSGEKDEVDVIVTEDDDSTEVDSNNVFVPTDEWQEIKEGQVVPGGLHYRINLSTGKKEAKLDTDRSSGLLKNTDDVQDEDILKTEKTSAYRKATFVKADEESLKRLASAGGQETDTRRDEDIKKKFRSIDELKEEFEKLNLMPKSETEAMKELVDRFRKASNQEKKTILQDLEYYVHKYDNAIDFFKMAGLQMILPELNSTDPAIRSLVCQTLGSATQNNAKVQIAAYENNVIDALLRVLASDPSPVVQKTAIFALSAELRHFPLAQQYLVKSGGLALLAGLFRDARGKADPSILRLRSKAIALVNDLLLEQDMKRKTDQKSEQHQEAVKQYNAINLPEALKSAGFCNILPEFLPLAAIELQESMLDSMEILLGTCSNEFKRFLPVLKQLLDSAEETDSDANLDEYIFRLKSLSNSLNSDGHQTSTKEEL